MTKLDLPLAAEVMRTAVKELGSRAAIATWDPRVERDKAHEFLTRVIAELIVRGAIPKDPSGDGWAEELREKSLGSSTDALLGSKTISELAEADLNLVGQIANVRERYATYLLDILNAREPTPFSAWVKRD